LQRKRGRPRLAKDKTPETNVEHCPIASATITVKSSAISEIVTQDKSDEVVNEEIPSQQHKSVTAKVGNIDQELILGAVIEEVTHQNSTVPIDGIVAMDMPETAGSVIAGGLANTIPTIDLVEIMIDSDEELILRITDEE
jgi:hypothetical protein